MTNKEIIQISKSKPKKSQSCVPLKLRQPAPKESNYFLNCKVVASPPPPHTQAAWNRRPSSFGSIIYLKTKNFVPLLYRRSDLLWLETKYKIENYPRKCIVRVYILTPKVRQIYVKFVTSSFVQTSLRYWRPGFELKVLWDFIPSADRHRATFLLQTVLFHYKKARDTYDFLTFRLIKYKKKT